MHVQHRQPQRRSTASRQQGLTFLGLLIVGVLVAMAALVAAQVFPTYVEFVAIQKASVKAAQGSTVAEVRSLFDKAAAIDNISSVRGADLTVTKAGDAVVVGFSYSKEIHLAGPAWLVMKYQGSSR